MSFFEKTENGLALIVANGVYRECSIFVKIENDRKMLFAQTSPGAMVELHRDGGTSSNRHTWKGIKGLDYERIGFKLAVAVDHKRIEPERGPVKRLPPDRAPVKRITVDPPLNSLRQFDTAKLKMPSFVRKSKSRVSFENTKALDALLARRPDEKASKIRARGNFSAPAAALSTLQLRHEDRI